jgi:hypothetical protein
MTATLTRPGPTMCLPRFSTPRDPTRATLGPQVAEISRRLGQPLMPWQQLVVDVALELLPDGSFAYDTVVLTVPRQSGKTWLVIAKTVWRLCILAKSHGPQTSTYTAQKRQAARKRMERTFAPALRRSKSFVEVTNPRARPRRVNEWRLSLNNGSECIQIKDSFWQIEALSEDAGHGDTLDDGTIDEARFQIDDRTEAAMAPAMSTRADPQKWIISTAGGADSSYLYRKVSAGRAACDSGEHGTTAFFDWSAPDDADPGDPDTWRGCSPALGHTITERFLQSEWDKAQREGHEAIDTFCQEYLNRWMEIPVLDDDDAGWILPRDNYLTGTDPESKILADPSLAIAVSPDRQWAALAAAGASNLGGVHAGVLRYAEGTAWIVEEVQNWGASVSLAKDSPAMSLVSDLEHAGVEVHQFNTQEQGQAFGKLFDLVSAGEFWHPDQPHLDLSVKSAELRLTEGGVSVLSPKRSSVDISPLVAVTLAASKHLQPVVNTESVYETRGPVEL